MDSHLNTALLISSAQDEAALELSSYNRDYFLATLRSRGVTGTARVGAFLSNGLADLFAFFALHWKGWEGSQHWGSLDGELSLDAQSDRLGHVFLTASLRDGSPARWTLCAELVLEAGMLPTLAARAREFEADVLQG
jgi:hypothetical protein